MSAIRAVSLDAAGTIIRVSEPVAVTYSEIASQHGITVDAAAIGKTFRTVFPRMPPLAFGDGGELQRQEREWWRTLVRNCLGRFGQHARFNQFFDELFQHYAQPEAWCVFDDVRPLLAGLEARGIPVVVVSNFDSRLHGILRGFALHDAFREVLCSSMVGSAKPDARIFTAACSRLQVQPGHVLHVGDDRRADYDGARRAGLRALWLDRTAGGDLEPDRVATLDAVPQALSA